MTARSKIEYGPNTPARGFWWVTKKEQEMCAPELDAEVEIEIVGTAPLLVNRFRPERFLWVCHQVLDQPLR